VVQALVREWTEPSKPCIQHWCDDGVEKTKDLRQDCICPLVSMMLVVMIMMMMMIILIIINFRLDNTAINYTISIYKFATV